MAPMRRRRRPGFQSSQAKDLVREKYDLPLVEAVARRKNSPIRYFGLPGVQALDLRSWGHLCEYVAAVEVFPDQFQQLKHQLRTQFGTLEHRAHLGDVDEVILRNGGRNSQWTFVSTTFREDVGFIWDFDVVYLDYYGKFLPYNRGGTGVQKRARALRHLFASDRQNAWQPWLLVLTVESRLFGPQDRSQMRQFLTVSKEQADEETGTIIDYLLSEAGTATEQAARLVHGTLSYIIAVAASNSDVSISPRPTVLYRGGSNTPMLHFAYEMSPSSLLSGYNSILPLLRSPFLSVRDDHAEPWFQLLPSQPPGQTESALRATLDFLDERQINQIV